MKKEIPILMSAPMIEAIIAGRKTVTRRIIEPQPIVDEDSGRVFDGGHRRSPYDIHNWIEPFIDDYSKCLREDLLYVRENWKMVGWHWEDSEVKIQYADGEKFTYPLPDDDNNKSYDWMVKQFEKLVQKEIYVPLSKEGEEMDWSGKPHPFSPSIHLPKFCSRIWLEVANVKIERLQDITPEQAIAEGIGRWTEERMKSKPTHYQLYYLQPGDESMYSSNPIDSYESLWKSINGPESWKENPWVWVIEFKVLSIEGKPEEE